MTVEILNFLKNSQVIFAVSIVLVSSFSSVIVAIVNGIYNRKTTYLELYFPEKLKAYGRYIDCLNVITTKTARNEIIDVDLSHALTTAALQAKLFAPEAICEMIDVIFCVHENFQQSIINNSHDRDFQINAWGNANAEIIQAMQIDLSPKNSIKNKK